MESACHGIYVYTKKNIISLMDALFTFLSISEYFSFLQSINISLVYMLMQTLIQALFQSKLYLFYHSTNQGLWLHV